MMYKNKSIIVPYKIAESKKNKFNLFSSPILIIGYYVVLITILLSWHGVDITPPMTNRLIYVVASVSPFLVNRCKYTLPAILLMMTYSFYGAYHSYFPAEVVFILPLLLILLLYSSLFKYRKATSYYIFLFLGFYTLFIDVIYQAEFTPVSLSFIAAFIFGLFIKDSDDLKLLGVAFCLTSVLLSIHFFTAGEEFIHNSEPGFERIFIRDPNYFGAVIGCGVVIAFQKITQFKKNSLIENIIYIGCVVISVVVLLLNASRGALLSVSVSVVISLLFSPIQSRYKLLFIILSVIGVFLLYLGGYFELIQYRVESGNGTGSGRTIIWGQKMNYFYDESIVEKIVGIGQINAHNVGMVSFHNDFIAYLLGYGLLGVSFFITVIISPLLKSIRYHRYEIMPIAAYILFAILTIEPFFSGHLTFMIFLVYLYKSFSLNDLIKQKILYDNKCQ